jgi:hypothetical protein
MIKHEKFPRTKCKIIPQQLSSMLREFPSIYSILLAASYLHCTSSCSWRPPISSVSHNDPKRPFSDGPNNLRLHSYHVAPSPVLTPFGETSEAQKPLGGPHFTAARRGPSLLCMMLLQLGGHKSRTGMSYIEAIKVE